MTEEKRLSISFGKFSCEIVGYDEPFAILAKVVDILSATPGWSESGNAPTSPEGRKRFAEALDANARALDLSIDQVDGRFVISASEDDRDAPDADGDEAPTALTGNLAPEAPRSPLHLSPEEPETADAESAPEPAAESAPAPEAEIVAAAPAPTLREPATEETAAAPDEVAADDVAPDAAGPDETGEWSPAGAVAAVLADFGATAADDKTADDETADAGALAADDAANADAPETPAAEIPATPSTPRAEVESAAPATEPAPEAAAPQEPAAETAPVKTSQGVTAPRKPKIVVDHAKSRSHPRRRVSVNATVVKSGAEQQPAAEPALTLRAEDIAEDDLHDEADQPTAEMAAETVTAPEQPKPDGSGEEDENFLFADEEPLQLTTAEATEAEDERAAPTAAPESPLAADEKPEPKKRRGPLGLGIFRRRTKAEEAESKDDSGFDRLRETAEASLPVLDEPARPAARKGDEPKIFALSDSADLEDADSPAAFARQMGAQSLQDLLEASAAYIAIVEGKAHFSRRDVMQALNDIGAQKEYTPEARMKSFRKLVTAGAIVRADDGMFAISHATRFGYETQIRARG